MNAKFHLCLLLIILATITVQGAVKKNPMKILAKRGECRFEYWWRLNVIGILLSEFLNMTMQIKPQFGSHVTSVQIFSS